MMMNDTSCFYSAENAVSTSVSSVEKKKEPFFVARRIPRNTLSDTAPQLTLLPGAAPARRPRARAMVVHRRARSPRAAARVALCLVALLAAASVASAVSFSETDKRSAHESHHARKARLQEEVAAAELATREKYEAKMSSLERTTERLRREAEETVASLSAERDALSRNLTKYKRGLLNLDAKRKSETETLRAETERLRAEREELQAKLEHALDDALSATKAAADAKRESRAIARAAKAEAGASDETKRKIDEILTGASSSLSAGIGLVAGVAETVSGALARAARVGRALRPRNALRVVAAAARDGGWLPVAASATEDDAAACLAAVVVAAALGALAAKGRAVAEWLARVASFPSFVSARAPKGTRTPPRARSSNAGSVGRRRSSPPAFPNGFASSASEATRSASDSDEYELVDDDDSNPSLLDSPTRAAADAARSFDASPEAFERSLSSPESYEVFSLQKARGVGVSARVAALEENAARGDALSPGFEPDAGSPGPSAFRSGAHKKRLPPSPRGMDRESPPDRSALPDRDARTPAAGEASEERRSGTENDRRSRERSVPGEPTPSPAIRDGALKSALRRLAEALATPSAPARAFSFSSPARFSETPPSAPAARTTRGPTNADPNDDDDDDDAAKRTRRVKKVVETSPGFTRAAGVEVPVTTKEKKTPANVTSASFVRTPAPPPAGGRTPGSGDSASSADRGGGASSVSGLRLVRAPSLAGAKPPVTPRDRMVAYSQKLRRGVNVEIPALDAPTPPWGGDAIVAGGVRHPKGWAS